MLYVIVLQNAFLAWLSLHVYGFGHDVTCLRCSWLPRTISSFLRSCFYFLKAITYKLAPRTFFRLSG